MADHSITIANATTALGMSPPNLWNAYNWNAFIWGYTLDLPLDVGKGIAETEAATTAVGFDVTHPIGESVSSDSAVGVVFSKYISESVTADGDLEREELSDSAGYTYVFPDNATNAEDRDLPTWTSGTAQSAIWTSGTVSSTTWT